MDPLQFTGPEGGGLVAVVIRLVKQTLKNKMLSYRRETALQAALALAKSGRLELGDTILQTL